MTHRSESASYRVYAGPSCVGYAPHVKVGDKVEIWANPGEVRALRAGAPSPYPKGIDGLPGLIVYALEEAGWWACWVTSEGQSFVAVEDCALEPTGESEEEDLVIAAAMEASILLGADNWGVS